MDILCVEDNADFSYFIDMACKKVSIPIDYEIVSDGKAAMERLFENKDIVPRPPRLIFLDINLPDVNGLDILKTIKENGRLRDIPVIMLSSSSHPSDISHAYQLGANAYVSKPVGYRKLQSLFEDSCNFWLKHNRSTAFFSK